MLFGSAQGMIVGPDEKWEDVGILKYPNLQYFVDMVTSERYQKESLAHRDASIEDWRLIIVEGLGGLAV